MNTINAHLPNEEKRKQVSSIFIAMLMGLAYSELVPPIRACVRSEGFTIGTSMLTLTFVLTSTRWLIGGLLHLLDPKNSGKPWFMDFLVITFQTMTLVFMGGLCSVSEDMKARTDFAQLLILLLSTDVVWLLVRRIGAWIFERRTREKQPKLPMQWAYLNTVLITCILATRSAFGHHTSMTYILMGAMNIFAFILDVLVFDPTQLIRAPKLIASPEQSVVPVSGSVTATRQKRPPRSTNKH